MKNIVDIVSVSVREVGIFLTSLATYYCFLSCLSIFWNASGALLQEFNMSINMQKLAHRYIILCYIVTFERSVIISKFIFISIDVHFQRILFWYLLSVKLATLSNLSMATTISFQKKVRKKVEIKVDEFFVWTNDHE